MDETLPPRGGRPHCFACGQPVRRGEPHWAGDRDGRPWHYACAERAGLTWSWANLRAARAWAEDTISPSPSTGEGLGRGWQEALAGFARSPSPQPLPREGGGASDLIEAAFPAPAAAPG